MWAEIFTFKMNSSRLHRLTQMKIPLHSITPAKVAFKLLRYLIFWCWKTQTIFPIYNFSRYWKSFPLSVKCNLFFYNFVCAYIYVVAMWRISFFYGNFSCFSHSRSHAINCLETTHVHVQQNDRVVSKINWEVWSCLNFDSKKLILL